MAFNTIEQNYNPLIRMITGIEMPVICAVNGVAAGAGANLALALIKKALSASATNSLDEQLDLEAVLQRNAGRSEDYREGAMSFLEKRKPVFQGK